MKNVPMMQFPYIPLLFGKWLEKRTPGVGVTQDETGVTVTWMAEGGLSQMKLFEAPSTSQKMCSVFYRNDGMKVTRQATSTGVFVKWLDEYVDVYYEEEP